jgi:hypothetical protein
MARDFLWRGGWESGWGVRESTTGEPVSLLSGHVADVEGVALDPRPGTVAYDDVELWCTREFIELLVSEHFISPPR